MLERMEGRFKRVALALVASLACAACTAPGSARNLAPLFSEHSMAGGGSEIEALAGSVIVQRPSIRSAVKRWYVKPIVSWRRFPNGDELSWLIPPLGSHRRSGRGDVYQFLPLFHFSFEWQPDGTNTWTWISLPLVIWAKTADGRIVRAWFPLGGVVEHFLSFDRAEFVLFPLFSRVQRSGRTTYHFLWPIFSYSHGAGGPAWRVWPLIGHKRWKGRYDRWFFLWPIFQYQRNKTALESAEEGRAVTLFPLYQTTRQGSMRSTSVLFPFFGFARDSESGFWAWDGPWPLVRFMSPGSSDSPTRWRVWPFYSYYQGDGLTSRYFLWPFVNFRDEIYPDGRKKAAYILPFWQSWDRLHDEEGLSRYRKLWPLWRHEESQASGQDWRFDAYPALNPLWRTPVFDEHWAWIWELYTRERHGDDLRQRSWLGLWRRETDQDEDRVSLSGLWARRRYSQAGRPVTETSFLFGLLRFRWTEGDGIDWLRPALPGPGWPLQRVPNSLFPRGVLSPQGSESDHESQSLTEPDLEAESAD
jgi:hypothetical protein